MASIRTTLRAGRRAVVDEVTNGHVTLHFVRTLAAIDRLLDRQFTARADALDYWRSIEGELSGARPIEPQSAPLVVIAPLTRS